MRKINADISDNNKVNRTGNIYHFYQGRTQRYYNKYFAVRRQGDSLNDANGTEPLHG
jgi:hypothetical protein